jgi:two-component system, sensor histidine kinase YesM
MQITDVKRVINTKVKFNSLRTKLLLSLLILFTFSITVMTIDNAIASNIIKKKINASVINSVSANNTYLSFIFNKAKEVSNNLATEITLNNNILDLFNYASNSELSEYSSYMAIKDLIKKIAYISQQNEYIDSIYIYSDQLNQVITGSYGVHTYEQIKEYGEMNKIKDASKVYTWLSNNYDEAISHKNLISLLSRADIIDRAIKSKVYISVNFYYNSVYSIVRNLRLTPNTMVYLIDENNNVVASQKQKEIGNKIERVLNTNNYNLSNEEFSRIKLKPGGYHQKIYQKNNVSGVGILVLIPEDELLKEERIFILVNIIILLLTFTLLIGASFKIISHYVDKPLKIILASMQEVEKGNFDSQIVEKRMDEFGYLYKSYNMMVQKIKTLIQELYEEKLLKQAAEIKILQKQINPHFLYNTLDSINWAAKANNVQDISQVVVALSNHYRTVFNRGSDFIRIEEMLDSIRDYLYIAKFRYGDRFTYEICADEKVNKCLILNLLLQPIVENALIHGIDKIEDEGRVIIKTKLETDCIYFNVIDNGKGMSSEKLQLLQASIYRQNSNYDSGMKNVHNRIRLFYGEEYGIAIRSIPFEGTNIEIKLPYKSKEN